MTAPDPQPTSFLTLERGTPVVDRFGEPVGEVHRVLIFDGGGFDGVIVRTPAGRGSLDAPEARRIAGGAVTLGITVADVATPGADGPRMYGVPAARIGRTEVTEADRDEAVERAYVRDDLTTDDLGDRVAVVHLAETLEALD